MSEIIMEFLVEVDAALVAPLTQASIQVAILTLSNLIFYTIVHEYLPEALYFVPLAFGFGLFHLFLFASGDLVFFSLITAMFFATFLHIATFISEMSQYRCNHILKFFVICYALVCFRFNKDKDDFDEYLITFIVMTVKLFCAAEEMEGKTFEEIGENHGILIMTSTLISYMTYTAWVSYKDFLILRNKQHEKGERWWNIMASAGSRAILFKVLSYKLVHVNIVRDFWLWVLSVISGICCLKMFCFRRDQIFNLIQAFQSRCKYYYRAQIAELEIIAAGVKKGGWNKHIMFNFEHTEFSVVIKDFLIAVNIPLSSYLRNKFTTKNRSGRSEILLHVSLFLVLIFTYNIYIGCLWFWFIISIYLQEKVLRNASDVCDICLFTCKSKFCYHKYGRRRKNVYYIIKFTLILLNHFRLSLLFVRLPTAALDSSLRCTVSGLIIDVIIAGITVAIREPQHQYFALANKPQSS